MFKILETLEKRREAYRKTWGAMKKSEKLLCVSLVIVGILNLILGIYMASQ